jgi:tetratricopeptide (TPR) repeat protein
MKNAWKSLGAVCALVIGMYAYSAPLGKLESLISNPADAYYNLLVQGFREGHLSVKKDVPTGFARLADPYDPAANRLYQDLPYGLRDMSYYKGRLYLYFGVTPALIVFWPFVALTGHYLFDRQAATIFCAVGILASVGLLRALWRRYFSEVSVWVVAACALALGLATGVPALLPRSYVHEVTTSCGYMLTMLALGAIWCGLHEPKRRCRWLAAASVAYGLAVGARPNLLFGAVILLVPVIQAWRERRPIWAALMAATIPITLIGLGLMLYNELRFDNPFEFGVRYQLAAQRQVTRQFFSFRYLWFNFRVYFLEPARWSGRFPFVRGIAVPPLPAGYYGAEDALGILTNIPLVWLALAAPLAWRNRSGQGGSILRWFVAAAALLFGICALTIGTFMAADMRYAVDFLPALVLLAVVGILGLERARATPGAWLAGQPVWRRLVRWGWGLLLGFSVVFNVLVSVKDYAYAGCSVGTMLTLNGRVPEAIRVFENALRIEPDYAEGHHNLGNALWKAGNRPEAIREDEYALRLNPDYADAHVTLGAALVVLGKPEDAIRHFEEALRIFSSRSTRMDKYGCGAAHMNIGLALLTQGKARDAMAHYEEALRINPDYAEAHNKLGVALMQGGRVSEAIKHWEEALRINPDYAEAHYNYGVALQQLGDVPEAIGHYEQALRIDPDYAEAHNNLGVVWAHTGKIEEAIAHFEHALRIKPDYAEAHDNMGIALEKAGRRLEAIEHYKQALRLRPDLTAARNALARLQGSQ